MRFQAFRTSLRLSRSTVGEIQLESASSLYLLVITREVSLNTATSECGDADHIVFWLKRCATREQVWDNRGRIAGYEADIFSVTRRGIGMTTESGGVHGTADPG